MTPKHTWTPDHPHANDREWTEPRGLGRFTRTDVWSWSQCKTCGAKTAVSNGPGNPVCDECFEVQNCEDCLSATGGVCRVHAEPECSCYEIIGGHAPGCAFSIFRKIDTSGGGP